MVQKRKSTAIRKQQIMDAARKLIIRKGSEHLTVRALAREVNLTEAAIYRHFKSKREILSFLMNHIMEGMLQDVERTVSNGLESLDTVALVLRQHLSEIEQRKGMSFQVIAEIISLGDKRLNREVYEKLQLYIGQLGQLLSQGLQTGHIRPNLDLEACATLLFGMIQGLVNIWALGGYHFDLLSKYESMWSIFRVAIQPEPAA
jgi:AcrR family transcriptional regulator